MSLLVVGGDRVDAHCAALDVGRRARIHHWSGRKPGDCHRHIPDDTRLVVIFVDFVNHGLATRVRRQADSRGLPVVFSKGSASSLASALRRLETAQAGQQ